MIKKHTVKSCCGNKSYILELESAVTKSHLETFKKLGYLTPKQFTRSGIFYVQREGLIARASFGTTKVSVSCNSKGCPQLMAALENTLDSLTKNDSG